MIRENLGTWENVNGDFPSAKLENAKKIANIFFGV